MARTQTDAERSFARNILRSIFQQREDGLQKDLPSIGSFQPFFRILDALRADDWEVRFIHGAGGAGAHRVRLSRGPDVEIGSDDNDPLVAFLRAARKVYLGAPSG